MRPKKNINVEIGVNIQRAREKAGYTQEKLSELLGISTKHMGAIEQGASGVTLEAIRALCSLLGVSADYLIFGEVAPGAETHNIALRLASVRAEYQPQVNKVLSALMEISAIMPEEGNTAER